MARNKRRTPRQATSAVAFEHAPPPPGDPLLAFQPFIHAQPRRNSITPDLQRQFIAHLAATGIVSSAARRIGRSMEALYKLRHRPGAEGFAAAWDRAVDRGVQRLEDTALARAIEGEERAIVRNGEIVGLQRHHNEALTMFFLRHRLPARYGPQQEKPSEALYAELEARALGVARELVQRERDQQVADLLPLLDHMVKNRVEGRAYITGVDVTKTIAENAKMMRNNLPKTTP
ncbi:hypothetical protein [Altererythrobacter sp. Z27]|uniref:hypothetical protein n=1 Tax=Altererythrobacter sp. Z27 TaxID=3461147 RepID=UPI004043F7B9